MIRKLSPSFFRSRPFAGVIAAAVLIVAAWLVWGGGRPGAAAEGAGATAAPRQPPVPVRLVSAERGSLAVRQRAIGTVTPLAAVTVRSRVEGELHKVVFEEGQHVRKGQVLAEIDPARYRAQLARAEGQLRQNAAQLRNAENDLARFTRLLAEDSIARQQVEAQEALVEQLRGNQVSLQGEVDDARLQLAWTRIVAPIAGRAGLRRVDAGNLVGANDGDGLLTIAQMQPIAVVFAVPEQTLGEIRARMASGRPVAVEAWDRDDRRAIAHGTLKTFDNQVEVATGTVRLKAEFANADEALFPNQFVNVRLALGDVDGAVVIPADAVQFGAKGSYVYVVEDGRARVRMLTLGASEGGRVVVEAGLQGGERVVLEGLDRLREGREVVAVEDEGEAGAAAGASDSAAGG